MTESICLNPYIFGIDKGRNKRGMCAFETARKIRKLWAERSEQFEKQFGISDSKQAVSAEPFRRRPFGFHGAPDALKEFVPTVVSLALYDGEEQLFECSGIAVQTGESTNGLTRFLTSEHLVAVFNDMRNRKDELRIEVGLPFAGMGPINGFLELYDDDIAIVTSLLSRADVIPLYLYREEKYPSSTKVLAAGRQFMSHTWRLQPGNLLTPSEGDPKHLGYSDCQILEHGLGGPLLRGRPGDAAGICFVGINIRYAEGKTTFLPRKLIRERLEQYQILTHRDVDESDDSGQEDVEGGYDSGQEDLEEGDDSWQEDVEEGDDSGQEETDDTSLYGVGSSSGTNEISYQEYSPPAGAKVIVPSGFMRKLKWLDAMGYPKPPPLMLELNGELLHTFEDFFGYLFAWRGYLFNLSFCGEGPNPWARLDSNIIKSISRRVVSLASFNGARRLFACTGLLIKCRVGRHYGSVVPSRTVILTSASLVRTHDASAIDEKLKIEVFLPPKQRVSGALLAYDSCYNLAIVSVEGLRAICPEDVLLADTPQDQSRDRQLRKMCREEPELQNVVAIGREPEEGLLCGSMGVVSTDPITRGCKDLRLSTCKIKKAGIGGPLINFADGSFVGMNFYDGRTDSTPFLPRRYILKVLHKLELPPSGRDHHAVQRLDSSDDGMNHDNRWHVPKARWYHSLLEVDRA